MTNTTRLTKVQTYALNQIKKAGAEGYAVVRGHTGLFRFAVLKLTDMGLVVKVGNRYHAK